MPEPLKPHDLIARVEHDLGCGRWDGPGEDAQGDLWALLDLAKRLIAPADPAREERIRAVVEAWRNQTAHLPFRLDDKSDLLDGLIAWFPMNRPLMAALDALAKEEKR